MTIAALKFLSSVKINIHICSVQGITARGCCSVRSQPRVTDTFSPLSANNSLPCAVLACHEWPLGLRCLKHICGCLKLAQFTWKCTRRCSWQWLSWGAVAVSQCQSQALQGSPCPVAVSQCQSRALQGSPCPEQLCAAAAAVPDPTERAVRAALSGTAPDTSVH